MVKNPDSKANPKTRPGSLQRLVRQSKVPSLKNLRPNFSEIAVTAGRATAPEM